MRDLQPVLPSLSFEHRGMNRANHLRWMGTQPIAQQLPSESLRDEIDGPDLAPQRRQFARRIDLYEFELRKPAPGVTWLQLQRGHAVPMGGLPTKQQRIDQRAYNEYCEPHRNWQRRWDADTARIAYWTRRIRRQRLLAGASACIVALTAGVGLVTALSNPITWPLAVSWVALCILSVAYHRYVRAQRVLV